MNQSPPDILYLSGILQRSGTNYLYNLLSLHPALRPMSPKGEDFLLKEARELCQYAFKTSANWHPMWGGGMDIDQQRTVLLAALGKGLLTFLAGEGSVVPSSEPILAKTPDTTGITFFPELFPAGKVIFLVRRPESTIESGVKSFGWTYRSGLKAWKESAERIISFREKYPEMTLVVQYEALMESPEVTLKEIFGFAGLDSAGFPFQKIQDLPVVGSSTLGKEDGQIAWKGVRPGQDFDPTKRGAQLPEWRQIMVYHYTQEQIASLGYAKPPSIGHPTLIHRLRQLQSSSLEYPKDWIRAVRKKRQTRGSNQDFQCKNGF